MPIEIKELHIRVTVNAADSASPSATQPSGPPAAGNNGATDREALLAECVEQVLHILQEKQER